MKFPFEIARLPRQRRLFGHLVAAFNPVLMLVCIVSGIAFANHPSVPIWLGVPVFSVLIFATASAAMKLKSVSMRLRQPDALSAMKNDPRSPVLFLRSFDDDDVVDLTSRMSGGGIKRAEERVCDALRKIGPVIAIGRPTEALPEVGAARLYVDDQNWQKAVGYFLDRAGAVVIVVGVSAGVWWEIETALERVERRRLLFYFPFLESAIARRSFWHRVTPRTKFLGGATFEKLQCARDERYRLFKERLGADSGLAFPERLGEAQFVTFSGESTLEVLPTVRPSIVESVSQASWTNFQLGIHVGRTLNPFVTKLI